MGAQSCEGLHRGDVHCRTHKASRLRMQGDTAPDGHGCPQALIQTVNSACHRNRAKTVCLSDLSQPPVTFT